MTNSHRWPNRRVSSPMEAMVGVSVSAWKAAAAPIRSAPPPRKSICRVRKFWVAASEAPRRKQATRKPKKVSGMPRTFGVATVVVAPGSGLIVRHTQVPKPAASGAYTNGIRRRPKPCSRAPDAPAEGVQQQGAAGRPRGGHDHHALSAEAAIREVGADEPDAEGRRRGGRKHDSDRRGAHAALRQQQWNEWQQRAVGDAEKNISPIQGEDRPVGARFLHAA